MAVEATKFFEHINDFLDYRQSIYRASKQTLKSNLVDLTLFQRVICDRNHSAIDGPTVMAFQYHLKMERNNIGGSINRKIFTLRSYSHFLTLMDVPQAENLPFYDVLKINSDLAKQVQKDIKDILNDVQYRSWTTSEHYTEALASLKKAKELGNWSVALSSLKHEQGLLNVALLDEYIFVESKTVKDIIASLEKDLN